MINSELFDLFTQDNVDKQAKIEYSGGVMTNEELFQNSESLEESLCSQNELRFGCCEAGCFKFKVANIMKPLMGEWVKYSVVVSHREDSPLPVGMYKVASDKLTADRMHREVVAYDAMYDILNADMAAWYNSVLPGKDSTMTMKQFRESFIRHFGLTEVVPKGGLVNDDMTVEKTIDPEQISGKDVITSICEINGCFGHIGRDGNFHYIYLPQAIEGLYPADDLFPDHAPEWMAQAKTGHLYPQDPKSTKIGTGTKINCTYEDFRTKPITRLQIRKEENDIGRIWPDGEVRPEDNCYIIQDNFLVYGKSHEELGVIAENIFGKITDITYRPFNAYCAGNPCFEVGDPVRLTTKYDIIESYILKRTLKGVQALRDTYIADGAQKYSEKVNGVHKSIIQLKGKANILTRTIEETKLEMYDIAEGLNNTITITARDIRAELKNTADGLSNTITVTAGEIRGELKDTADGLSNTITVTAKGLRADIEAEIERATGEEEKLSTSISVNANGIAAEIRRASEAEGTLSASIKANADNISLKVSKDSIVSEINQSAESVTIKAGKIDLKGLVSAEEFTSKYATIDALDANVASINKVVAQKAAIDDLDAVSARVGDLEADHVSVGDLDAANARIDTLSADKIDASTVKTDYMEVDNWTSNGYIKAGKIDVGKLMADMASVSGGLSVSGLRVYNSAVISGTLEVAGLSFTGAQWKTVTINGKSYILLAK